MPTSAPGAAAGKALTTARGPAPGSRLALGAAFALLSPLLWLQGRHARRTTPVLPEPAGPRAGRAGSGPRLRLLIAGDSAAAGVGVDHQHDALSGLLLAGLSPHFDLHWELIARTGTTTADLLDRLQAEPPRPFDVVVLSLGVNDVTGLVPLRRWMRQQRSLVELLEQRFQARQVILGAVPPMGEMLALPQPLRWVMGWRAAVLNAALAQAMSHQPCCEILYLSPSRLKGALATDGFHPGPVTYRAWAGEVMTRIRA